MKRTARIDAIRSIKKRFVSWLSIVTIVLIGASAILGLYFSYHSLAAHGNKYMNAHNARSMTLACNLGLKEKDLERVREIQGVKDVEGTIIFQGQLTKGENTIGLNIIEFTERISVPYLTEGSAPTQPDECALNEFFAKDNGINVGDTVEITAAVSRFSNILVNSTYTVTGMMSSPDYIKRESCDYCILPKCCFDTSDSAFDYTLIDIRVDAADRIPHVSGKLSGEINIVRNRIEEILPELKQERMSSISYELDTEYKKIADGIFKQLREGRRDINKAQKEYDDEIAKAQKELDDAEKELNDGKAKANSELAAALKKIRDGEAEYNKAIAEGQQQLADGERQLEKELQDAKWQIFDGFLKIDENEKLLGQKEEEYNEGLWAYKAGEKELAEGRAKLDEGWKEVNEGISKIDEILRPDLILAAADIVDEFDDDLANELCMIAELEPIARAYGIVGIYDRIFFIEEIRDFIDRISGIDEFRENLRKLKEGRDELERGEEQYRDGRQKLEYAKDDLEEGRKLLDQGWFSLEQAKKDLANAQNELAKKEPEARAQLAERKAEFEQKKAEGAKELEDAKKQYESAKKAALEEIALHEKELKDAKEKFEEEKAKAKAKLDEGWADYNSSEKDALDKLADIKKEIDDAKNMDCNFFVQTLDANLYFAEYKSACDVLKRVSIVFAIIYAGIIVIVCFFTMAIIVEEEAKQIGALKAFGLYKNEIRKKYLIFGVTAAFFGALIGIGLGFFFEYITVNSLKTLFTVGDPPHDFELWPFIATPVLGCVITCVSVYWSAEKILACTAVGLMSGNEPKAKIGKRLSSSMGGSIYAKLIINNFLMDWGRETVSVVIISACIFVTGLSTTIKLGHVNAMNNLSNNIFRFDADITLSESITDEQRDKFLEFIEPYESVSLARMGCVLQTDDGQGLADVYCVRDVDAFRKFYGIIDGKGKALDFDGEGLMVTIEMEDKEKLSDGDEVTMITDDLKIGHVVVNGHFALNVGKAAIMTMDYYEKVFGEKPKENDYMILTGPENLEKAKQDLAGLSGLQSVRFADDIAREKQGVSKLYSIVILIVLCLSFMLAVMILLNLSNILVSHRMKELLTMRVNGFSNSQVIGYLVREIVVTTSLGIILGVAIGIPAVNNIIPNVESNGFMFVRQTYPLAWLLATFSNTLFSVIINAFAFMRIGKMHLTDITKY